MKKTLFLLLILSSFFSYSQNEIKRELGDFYKIQTYDLLKVNLIKSDKNYVIISGQHPNYVVVKNKNGELKIRMGIEKRLSGSETKVDLYYKTIYRIEAKEGSVVFSKDTVSEPSLFLKSQNLKTETTKVFIKAGGVVDVYTTSLLELDLKAGGEVNVHHKTNKIIEKITLGGIVNYLYNK